MSSENSDMYYINETVYIRVIAILFAVMYLAICSPTLDTYT